MPGWKERCSQGDLGGSIGHLLQGAAASGPGAATHVGERSAPDLVEHEPEPRARELHAGMVWINSYKRVNPGSPFGGMGSSGYGREMGFEAMREYSESKAVWVNVDAALPAFYPRG